jgi:hypothetical protein
MNHEWASRVLETWQAGEPTRNAWMTIPDPYLAEFVGLAGLWRSPILRTGGVPTVRTVAAWSAGSTLSPWPSRHSCSR